MICQSYSVHNILHCIAYMQNAKCFALNHTQHTRYILYTILAVVAIQHRERDGRPYSSHYIYSIWPYLSLYCIAAASIVYIATIRPSLSLYCIATTASIVQSIEYIASMLCMIFLSYSVHCILHCIRGRSHIRGCSYIT